MSENSSIEWTTHTFNPWIGCTKVSPGCANCYAESEDKRRGWTPAGWGKGKPRKRTTPAYWKQAIRWNNDILMTEFERPRVFPSLCDWLDDEVSIEWLADFLNLIRITPNLDWLLLTKRPELFSSRIKAVIDHAAKTPSPHDSELIVFCDEWLCENNPPPNVWLGVSVEDQDRADQRVPKLLETPAALRFLSVEPLLGEVNLRKVHTTPFIAIDALETGTFNRSKIDWVIVGGESGPKARPCDIEWIRAVLGDCQATGTACFVKQLGAKVSVQIGPATVQIASALRDRKGGDPSEWPADLRVREMPALALAETTVYPVPQVAFFGEDPTVAIIQVHYLPTVGWETREGGRVGTVFPAKQQAVDYAKEQMRGRSGQVIIYNTEDRREDTIEFGPTNACRSRAD
jgi:protein gp37